MVTFTIEFDRVDRKYKPGQTIYCIFRLEFDTQTKVSSIYARCQGTAEVQWSETISSNTTTTTVNYNSIEKYFKLYKALVDTKDGLGVVMEPGSYVYKEFFELPNMNLPQDFKDFYGKVRYEVKVHAKVLGGFDQKEKQLFSIEPTFDLNDFPFLSQPVHADEKKTFGFSLWKTDPLQMSCILPRQGFVLGDTAQYTLEINNASSVTIQKATVKLIECIKFYAKSPSKRKQKRTRTIWEHDFKGLSSKSKLVLPLQTKVFSTQIFFDPAYEFKIFRGCEIIIVKYFIQSTVVAEGMYRNLENTTEVHVGTIPLQNSTGTHTEQPLPSYSEAVQHV